MRSSQWKYSFGHPLLAPRTDNPYFDPLHKTCSHEFKEQMKTDRTVKELKRSVIADGVCNNIQHLLPLNEESWKQMLAKLTHSELENTKLIYVTRHGESTHNVKSKTYGKGLYYQFYAINPDPEDIDPSLNDDGIKQARQVGRMLKAFFDTKRDMPRPTKFYSSPLRRCIQTGILTAREYSSIEEPTIHVRDRLREWIGWDHHHSSDQTSTKQEIINLGQDMGAKIMVDRDGEDDHMVNDGKFTTKEIYADVVVRMKEELDEIFDNDKNDKVIHLFLHNRCFRSFLRAIGYARGQDFDMQNCATVVFLVTRVRDANPTKTENDLRHEQEEDLKEILGDKAQLTRQAEKRLREEPEETAEQWYLDLTDDRDEAQFKQWRPKLDYARLDGMRRAHARRLSEAKTPTGK